MKKAAARFGTMQEKAADAWLDGVKASGAANPTLLLQAEVALFGECGLDENGDAASCRELTDAIGALQSSLGVGGKVVSTRGIMKSTSPGTSGSNGPPPPEASSAKFH